MQQGGFSGASEVIHTTATTADGVGVVWMAERQAAEMERLTHAPRPNKEKNMAYCIMRVEKRRRPAVYGLQLEANRTHDDDRDFARSNINRELTAFNMHLVKAENWNKAITTAIHDAGAEERKNSVVLLDGFYGASPDWFQGKSMEEIIDYFKACLAFHEREYGPAINAVIHFDETTIHMAVASIPLIRGEDAHSHRLSAKDIMGNRSDYRKRQDRFYEEVGKARGMERGESHDPENIRKHLTVQEFKKQQLEAQVEELQQQNKKLQADCKKLTFTNQKLQELNVTLAEQIEQPFLQYCMMEFIRNAKVRGERGEVKLVVDGFRAYMAQNEQQLRAKWEQMLLPNYMPAQEEERHHEREYEYDYDEIERE